MKENELRIGNLVFFGVNVVPIKSIHIDSVLKDRVSVYVDLNEKLSHYCLLINEVEPIPVTPEWLERAGFEVKDDNPKQKLHYEGDVLFNICEFEFTNSQIEGFRCYQINNGNTIYKYLHQLQNLFYALTGKELEFNLNVEKNEQAN